MTRDIWTGPHPLYHHVERAWVKSLEDREPQICPTTAQMDVWAGKERREYVRRATDRQIAAMKPLGEWQEIGIWIFVVVVLVLAVFGSATVGKAVHTWWITR